MAVSWNCFIALNTSGFFFFTAQPWQFLSQLFFLPPAVPTQCPWNHIGVLNAFGYVLASKTQRRFCTCAPDMSVAVIADAQRHLYLYRQNVSVLSPVRNRKTGQQVNGVSL